MTSARKRVHDFLMLPWHIQYERAARLGLYKIGDAGRTGTYIRWIKEAKERGVLDKLLPS